MSEDISYVGLDVHKSFIQVALLPAGGEEARGWRVPHAEAEVRKLVRTLRRIGSPVVLCYEAGPTGYDLSRTLNAEQGFACHVIAPSLIPKKAGERIKTDRRDAAKLAEFLKAGLLTDVCEPTADEEALRELCRARGAAKECEKRAKQQLSKFLLRHSRRYDGRTPWTKAHVAWLERQKFDNELLQQAYDSYVRGFLQARHRTSEITTLMEQAAQTDAVREPVALLRCFKGIDTITATTIVSELYSFRRFTSPRGLMGFLGMTPAEYSTGGKANRSGITKSGNGRVRKLLVEAAWNLTRSAQAGVRVRKRREDQPGWAVDIAERAQGRLHKRYWRLVGRGKESNKAVMAIARELVGFIWDMLMHYELSFEEANA